MAVTMNTVIRSLRSPEEREAALEEASRLLKQGALVAIPTETVYGLAADALHEASVREIFAVKGRPQDNPCIVHIASADMLPDLVTDIPAAYRPLMDAFWPGPLTLLFPKARTIPSAVTCGLATVGIRLPDQADTRALIQRTGRPLAAPSANRSGRPSPTTAQHVLADLNGRIPLILDAGPCAVGVESTVLAADGNALRILRPGGVTPDDIRRITGQDPVCDPGHRSRPPG